MKKGVRNFIAAIAVVFALGCSFSAKADKFVNVSFFTGLSPDPVNIVTGEIVFWFDNDGFGPYTIYGLGAPFDTPGGIQFLAPGSYDYFDDIGDTGTVNVTSNIPPSVTITNPVDHAVFPAPATFDFAADASDPDAGVSDVEFYIGTNIVDDVFFLPYTTAVSNLPAGSYDLSVIVYDNGGATATNSISITVGTVTSIQLTSPKVVATQFRFDAIGLTAGKTNLLYASTNLATPVSWVPIATNVATGSSMSFTNPFTTGRRFFRLLQVL